MRTFFKYYQVKWNAIFFLLSFLGMVGIIRHGVLKLVQDKVECSTFSKSRVAKVSKGPIPPPFLITKHFLNEQIAKKRCITIKTKKKLRIPNFEGTNQNY